MMAYLEVVLDDDDDDDDSYNEWKPRQMHGRNGRP
jgi:hypothetical protein